MNIETRPEVHCLSEPLEVWEEINAIDNIREGKAPGKCRTLSGIWKHGGAEILSKLYQLILSIWKEERVPQDWKDASTIPIFKKGSRKDCGNYRGIALLSIAGKILSRILLNRMLLQLCYQNLNVASGVVEIPWT